VACTVFYSSYYSTYLFTNLEGLEMYSARVMDLNYILNSEPNVCTSNSKLYKVISQ